MKINVIVPFYKNHDTLENLLRSLQDQDYKNFDVTLVADGYDEELYKKVCAWLDGTPEWKFNLKYECLPENKGASAARNFGAEISDGELKDGKGSGSGEILFFLDADCELYPGIFTEFISQFKKHPEIAFLYGNYRFEKRLEFYSQPFDPYLLETMNYICTMSPVRREAFKAVGGFVVDQPYFQDWSLFYRLAKAGYKGKFLKDFIFSTKLSDESNISGTQGLTLPKKCEVFRKSHNIKDRELAVTTLGAPLQAIQRAKMLDADYVGPANGSRRSVFPTNYQFEAWKGTYMVGCYSEPLQAFQDHLSVMWGGQKIYHFIGTDVFQLINGHSKFELDGIKAAFEIQKAKLFANSPRLVRELASVGIEAELLYTPIFEIEKYQNLLPMPERFTVGVYFSDTNPMHSIDDRTGRSNIPLIFDVTRSMPDVRFKFFGGKAVMEKDNVEWCGQIPEEKMPHFINSCSAVLRATVHDGFPQLPIQFLLCGRKALVSCPDRELAYAEKLSFEDIYNYESSKDEIISKLYALEKQKSPIQADVTGYYKTLMSEQYFKERIHKCLM